MSYVKTQWVNGDTITADKLNHIEAGIEANETENSLVKSHLEALADATAEPVYNNIAFTKISGKQLRYTDGAIVDSVDTYYVSDMIPVTALSTYYISARTNYNSGLLAWYNSSQVLISSLKGNGTSTAVELDKAPVVSPAGAAYLRIAWYIDATHTSAGCVMTLSEYADKIADDFNLVKQKVVTPVFSNVSFTSTSGKNINNYGNIADVASTAYCASDLIPVVGGQNYYISASSDYNNAVFAWYDASSNVVSRYNPGSTGSTHKVVTDKLVTAPFDASYLRIAYITPDVGAVKTLSEYKNILEDRVEALEAQSPTVTPDVSLVKSGNDLTVTDITSGMYVTAALHGSNNLGFNFTKYCKTNGTTYKNAGDDICPIFYDRSYRCGNHGNLVAIEVTSAAHGLTESDVGDVYTSANDIDYVIIKIVSADKFWMVNDAETNLTFNTTIPTSPLTKTGASVSFTSATLTQILPNINKITQSISVDGAAVTEDGTYTGTAVVVAEQYYSIDCIDMLATLKDNLGSNTNTSYYSDAIDGDLIYAVTYTIKKNLQIIVASKIVTLRDNVNFTSWGVTQSQSIGHRVFVPDSTDTGVWTASAQTAYGPAKWADSDFPPYKVYQFDDSDNNVGFAIAYVLDYANGIPATRKPLCPSMALNIAGTFKLYPFVVSMNVANQKPKYTVYSGIAVRQPIALSNTLAIAYEIGTALYVEVDNLTDSVATVSVPTGHNGQTIDVLHRSENVSVIDTVLHDNAVTVIGKGSISIKVA